MEDALLHTGYTYLYRCIYENFRELNFRGWRSILEKCENLAPRKFGAIRYIHVLTGYDNAAGNRYLSIL